MKTFSRDTEHRKVLIVATVIEHIIGFHIPYIKFLKLKGYEVHIACNGNKLVKDVEVQYNLPFTRIPFTINNIKAYIKLKKIINKENFDIIHCNTPVRRCSYKNCSKKK